MTDIVYAGHDNMFIKQLQEDGVALSAERISAITRIVILYKGIQYSSADHPTAFDWSSRADEGIICFQLGNIPDLPLGRDSRSELILYAPDYPDGIVWSLLDIKVTKPA